MKVLNTHGITLSPWMEGFSNGVQHWHVNKGLLETNLVKVVGTLSL